MFDLTAPEQRVLGCLIEKELTTPDYYPLTLNSLTAACNQTTNRNPVVNYSQDEVEKVLTSLREKNLCRRGVYPGSRVPKHRHNLEEMIENISLKTKSILYILLLRGQQTLGEIKQRTERVCDWESILEVEEVINSNSQNEFILFMKLPKLPGQKELRIKHLLGDNSQNEKDVISDGISYEGSNNSFEVENDNNNLINLLDLQTRIDLLEKRIEELEKNI